MTFAVRKNIAIPNSVLRVENSTKHTVINYTIISMIAAAAAAVEAGRSSISRHDLHLPEIGSNLSRGARNPSTTTHVQTHNPTTHLQSVHNQFTPRHRLPFAKRPFAPGTGTCGVNRQNCG